MSFEKRISNVPIAFNPEAALSIASDLPGGCPSFHSLVRGVSACSPYLRGLIERHRAWVAELPIQAPEESFKAILETRLPSGAAKSADELRAAKQKVALLTALADLGGAWKLSATTRALTEFADFATESLLSKLLREFARRKQIGPLNESELEAKPGLFVLAMGKMGAWELNYSSDIDLVALFETDFEEIEFGEVRQGFIRITQRLASLLSERTANGYVFRTDLRLRPDPRATQVCMSVRAAEQYYEAYGRTWERAVYIKARPCAGDLSAGARFLQSISPFVWRKYLDFATLAEAKDMRSRMRRHKGLSGPVEVLGHNMKLGKGGIREIEFFAQAFQIIAGGRDHSLRIPSTLGALSRLAAKGWIESECRDTLSKHYIAHRNIEHRLQMIRDARTHSLPSNEIEFRRLACLCGEGDVAAFKASIMRSLEEVHSATENLFRESQPVNEGKATKSNLANADKFIERWQSFPVMRERRAREYFASLQPRFLARLGRAADPGEALRHFDGFLSGLPAGVQLFSLFKANEQLVDLLVDICTTAPGLAHHLSRNAQVFDAVIHGDFFEPLPGTECLESQLRHEMRNSSDYEEKLDDARRWMKERHFKIGVHQLQGFICGAEAARCYSELAEAVIKALWPTVLRHVEQRHGSPPGKGACVVAMGSFGAGSLTPKSELDLQLVYDEGRIDSSCETRRQASRIYYARLTQALVSAISAPMPGGKLYSADMRMRPSGRRGPVAVSIRGFLEYQTKKAWTWEHLALTSARPIAGPSWLTDRFESLRRSVIIRKCDRAKIISDVASIREEFVCRSETERVDDAWETRLGPGRLLDLNILAHTAALLAGSPDREVADQLDSGRVGGLIDKDGIERLSSSYALLRNVLQVARLTVDGKFRPESAGVGASELLLRETGETSISALANRLEENRESCDSLISRLTACT
ncbi:MAG: glutamine-synthetase adenylyltransferase [Albidovulum sp.]|nr:glutamine-synthetase adenylyltransferase [Albidovulum sp.]